jgi:hypothetical protein
MEAPNFLSIINVREASGSITLSFSST